MWERPRVVLVTERHIEGSAGRSDLHVRGDYRLAARARPVGSDKRIGVLCVLDGSPKAEEPFPPEDGIGILKTADDAVAVVTVLIQGNLTRPSDLTRRSRSSRQKSAATRTGGPLAAGKRVLPTSERPNR
jgi:hypothetical protein